MVINTGASLNIVSEGDFSHLAPRPRLHRTPNVDCWLCESMRILRLQKCRLHSMMVGRISLHFWSRSILILSHNQQSTFGKLPKHYSIVPGVPVRDNHCLDEKYSRLSAHRQCYNNVDRILSGLLKICCHQWKGCHQQPRLQLTAVGPSAGSSKLK